MIVMDSLYPNISLLSLLVLSIHQISLSASIAYHQSPCLVAHPYQYLSLHLNKTSKTINKSRDLHYNCLGDGLTQKGQAFFAIVVLVFIGNGIIVCVIHVCISWLLGFMLGGAMMAAAAKTPMCLERRRGC